MKIVQLQEVLNDVLKESLGEEAIQLENIENVVDIGKNFENLLSNDNVDGFMKKLVNRIGKTIFVDRPYSGRAPSIMMDGWEYGSILQKIRSELPAATENPTWSLVNGQDYPVTKLTVPTASTKFFNQKDTYEIPMSFASKQLKQSFKSAQEANAFVSLIQGWIQKRKVIDRDELSMRTINTFTAATLYEAFGANTGFGNGSKTRAVNLLYLYNNMFGKELKAPTCMFDLDFIKFAAYTMGVTSDRMGVASKLFNIGKTTKFTPKNLLHVVLLSDFAKIADVYLQSETFHNEFTKFPEAERVSFWQGSGTDFSFESISKINVQVQNPTDSGNVTVECGGILGVMFDRDALGIANIEDYVTSFYNPHAEFENMWFKYDAAYFNDYDENFVVFYVADAA